ncbi:Caffeyl-CoA reductase-Etf complex subunit CarC [Paraconexibacter sp. AEG42_29]|uniref:Caffeyl-CoA reductase-Etf complex subunit CarC n=1 Tax=Paraconexibacter sp. AEG42_29 TaxID=2997339 RepID=A0AAU7B046_9ACTN
MDFTLSPAQAALQERATAAGAEFRDACGAWDLADEAPYREIFDRMGELGFFGLTMPSEFGGQDLSALDYLIATTAIFRASQTWLCCEPLFCTTGPGPSMIMLGDEGVREKYLPDIVAGRRGCNIALTEPNAGSALTHLSTTAKRDGDDYIVTGSKSYVTGAVVNDLHAVFVRFDDIPGAKGVGALVLEDRMEGVRVERGPRFVGDRGIPHGDLFLDEVRVPAENLIIGPGQFARLMSAFNMERLHNCAFWLGSSLAAYDEAAKHVQQREAFDRPLVEFQAVYHDLANMWTQIEALRLLATQAAATAKDGKYPDLHMVTMAKLFGATVGPQITLKSMELHGGVGVTLDAPIQRIHRDAISNVVAGGAPAVLRNGIAAGLFPGRRFPQTR